MNQLNPTTKAALTELLRRKEQEKIRYFKPNPGAQEIFFDLLKSHREVCYFAGNKSGKTYCGAKHCVHAALGPNAAKYGLEVLYDRPVHIWIGSVDYKVQRESAQECIDEFLINNEVKKIHRMQHGIYDKIEFRCGSTIGFKTYDQGRRAWQGPKRDIIWMDEEPPADVLGEARARLIGKDAKMIFTMTPLMGLTVIHEEFIEYPKPYRAHIVGSTYENKAHLTEEYLQTMEDLGEREKRGRLYGEFVRLEGLVYNEFDKRLHVIPHYDPDPKDFIYFGGMDFGADHPTAFVAAGTDLDGNIYVFREYKEVGGFEDHAKAWKQISHGYNVRRIFRDPSAKQAEIEFKRAGIRTFAGLNDRSLGISLINSLLKQKKIFISDRCVNLIYEFEHHRYKKQKVDSKDGDVVKADDDLLDALRYMIATSIKARPKKSSRKPILFGKRVARTGINW
jgi:PBSX family phage terminase large subunit